MAAMRDVLRFLIRPLNLAGMLTWAAVAVSIHGLQSPHAALHWTLLGLFLAGHLGNELFATRPRLRTGVLALQALTALALVVVVPRAGVGTAPILLVVVVAQLSMVWPPRALWATILVFALALYLVLRRTEFDAAPIIVAAYAGFQGFAALVGHYARSAELARDRLALVNADLLATRALLADSARDAERLRVARELHDVAGHKLTAMKLNLRALAAEPGLAAHEELRVAQQLSSELLDDIRGVVQTLRDTRGLDLHTALHALAAPLPRPRLALRIDETVRITDPAQAETILRLVQEALTNAARHADADTLSVQLARQGDEIVVDIHDDGRMHGRMREGNGIAGMRERLAAAHGTLRLDCTAAGAMHIEARLPT